MKNKYIKPEIKTEVLFKEDVLEISEETENRYTASGNIFKDNFKIEDIL